MNTDLIKHTMGTCGEQCCQYEGAPTLMNALVVVGAMLIIAVVLKRRSMVVLL